jgi:hypothetical protein
MTTGIVRPERRLDMGDEETVAQLRDVTGDAPAICENCGRPIDGARAEPDRMSMDLDDAPVRLCAECRAIIRKDEDPLDLDDE